jgi:hypothetical protein
LLLTNPYKEIGPMMQTTFERGYEKALRETALDQLSTRFGALPEVAQQRLALLPADKLRELLRALLVAPSLQALGLVDDNGA